MFGRDLERRRFAGRRSGRFCASVSDCRFGRFGCGIFSEYQGIYREKAANRACEADFDRETPRKFSSLAEISLHKGNRELQAKKQGTITRSRELKWAEQAILDFSVWEPEAALLSRPIEGYAGAHELLEIQITWLGAVEDRCLNPWR